MGLFHGSFYSHSLQMTTQLNVIFPEESNDVTPLIQGSPRVLYLLHGLSANAAEWTRFSKIEYYAKKYNFIIIMPEVQRSFYTDMAYGPRYFSYVADELPQICQQWFNLSSDPKNTFIAGESMGGYGAVKIALRRIGQYQAVGMLSGVADWVSLAQDVHTGAWPAMQPSELTAIYGPAAMPGPEDDLFVLIQAAAVNPNRPQLIQLCGTEDFFYDSNCRFRETAQAAGYGHTYLEWPGDHEWPFWDVAIQRTFQFFCGLPLDGPIF